MGKKQDELMEREQALTEREGALNERETALNERETALNERETALNEREEALQDRESMQEEAESMLDERANRLHEAEKRLNDKEKEIARGNVVMPKEKKELTDADMALIAKACDVYGIADGFVFSAGIDRSGGAPVAVVITHGGKRVRYRAGDEKAEDFCPLNEIQVTGVNPAAKKRKPIAGKKR